MLPFLTYRTLFGEDLDLGRLSKREFQCVDELLKLKRQNDTDLPAADATGSQQFLSQARKIMRDRYFLSYSRYLEALDGPVGAIFRDCFYRLHLDATQPGLDKDERKHFVERLRHNPARLLMDDFLGAWDSRRELATAAEFTPSTITRVFNYVWRPDSQEAPDEQNEAPGLALSTFHDACRRLNLVPRVARPQADANVASGADSTVSLPLEPSWRESCLADLNTALAIVMKWRHAISTKDDSKRSAFNEQAYRIAGFYLTLLYNIEDIRFITWRSAALIKRLLEAVVRSSQAGGNMRAVGSNSTPSSSSLSLPFPEELAITIKDTHKGTQTKIIKEAPFSTLFCDPSEKKEKRSGRHYPRMLLGLGQ